MIPGATARRRVLAAWPPATEPVTVPLTDTTEVESWLDARDRGYLPPRLYPVLLVDAWEQASA